MKRLFLFLILTTCCAWIYAQQFPDNSLGRLIKLSKASNSVTIETSNGNARVSVYTPEIVRIRISKENMSNDFSYAVVGLPQPCGINVIENKSNVQVLTDSIQIIISTNPVRFTINNYKGQLLNQDEPAFGTTWVGEEVTTYKKLQPGEKFIGLGEKTGNLDRRGEGYLNWNSDTPGYTVNQDPIYATFPFFIGVHDTVAYGIFLDNTFKSSFNFGASNDRYSSFGADAGEMNYYFIGGNSISRIIENYSWLTGRMPMPPIWGLGFQQSRWSYFPDSEVINIANSFRSKKIPLDVLYLDIHYMDNYKVFTWHPERFSKPKTMIDQLKNMGIHTAVIIDPGIKVEKGYSAYEDGIQKNMFLKYPDGTNYTAQVWPGWCNFPDFTNPIVRKWWGDNFKGDVDAGIDGYWNDMNEVASWGGGKTASIVHFNWEGKGASYRQGKNVYGMLMAKSTFEGTRTLMNRRPLILTRAAFSGAQRYTAIWTGDNVASEEHMMLGCRLVNSLGLSGMPFCGTDVGGFMNGDASGSLFGRWISIGTFTPFFRVHKNYDYKMSEPWSYGTAIENIARNYISLRYRLLPYIYSTFYEAHETGKPINRSLIIDNTTDEKCWFTAYQNQYMFGPSILVAPIESTKEIAKVYLPKGNWFDFFTGKQYRGNTEIMIECPTDKLPVFVKGGSFIPMQAISQSTSLQHSDTLFIHLYAEDHGINEYTYYEDDGTSLENEKGNFMTRVFRFDPQHHQIVLEAPKGPFISKYHMISLVLHGFARMEEFKIDDKPVKLIDTTLDILTSLSENDALYTPSPKYIQDVKLATFQNGRASTIIKW